MLKFYIESDPRPPKDGWANGGYTCKCRTCGEEFIGDKRAWTCAPCAYKENTNEQTN